MEQFSQRQQVDHLSVTFARGSGSGGPSHLNQKSQATTIECDARPLPGQSAMALIVLHTRGMETIRDYVLLNIITIMLSTGSR